MYRPITKVCSLPLVPLDPVCGKCCLSEIHVAVNARSDEMVACLGREMTIVRKKIPPDTKGLYGDSALHAACSNGHVEVGQH